MSENFFLFRDSNFMQKKSHPFEITKLKGKQMKEHTHENIFVIFSRISRSKEMTLFSQISKNKPNFFDASLSPLKPTFIHPHDTHKTTNICEQNC
jgi:hypothetical protein